MDNTTHFCPIHNSNKDCSLFWQFHYHNTTYSLYKCSSCDLLFYSPPPKIDYESHTDSMISIKDYVHLNSNVSGLINILLHRIPIHNPTSIMELGCGFGFILDFAKNILGMEETGFEPSLYGEMGAEELNVNINRRYLTPEDRFEKKFDIIFFSEVIEHVTDPSAFLDLLQNNLAETGVLILTTPNYKTIQKDLRHPSVLAKLSPGAHTILYSADSMKKILKKAGFKYIQVNELDSLIVVCSRKPLQFKKIENEDELVVKYYQNILERVQPQTLTYTGIVFRSLKEYIDAGQYVQAHELLIKYPFPQLPSLESIMEIKTEEDFYEPGPVSSSIVYYYYGMLAFYYYANYTTAAFYFFSSYLLCKKKLAIIPQYAGLEQPVLWAAKYFQALSLYMAESHTEALRECRTITEFKHTTGNEFMPVPEKEMQEKALQLTERIKKAQINDKETTDDRTNAVKELLKGVGFRKAQEIQDWYNKEYEVLPLWYKRLGHIIKIITGKRSLFKK